MYKSINQLIGEITSLAFLITNNTKIDIFTSYAGHVNSFIIEICEEGWSKNKSKDISQSIYLYPSRQTTKEKCINELNKIKSQFIKIAKKEKIDFSKLPYEIIEIKKYKLI